MFKSVASHRCDVWPLLIAYLALLCLSMNLLCTEASISAWRTRRQTAVSSAGQVNATGNMTSMSASNAMWKAPNGVIGANGTSMGSGVGPGSSSVAAGSNANVGAMSAQSIGAVQSQGANTNSSGMSSASNVGGQMGVQSSANGDAYGGPNSQVAASGAGTLNNGNQSSMYNGQNTMGVAGATGNQLSGARVGLSQSMQWSSIMANVYGISVGKGENNSQANLNLAAGGPNNGLAVNTLVSGVNDKGGGNTFALTEGKGTLANNTAAMSSGLLGAVNSTSGGSKLVAASNLASNGTVNGSTINTFGDLRLNGSGPGLGGLISNSSVNPSGVVNGAVGIQATGSGGNKSVEVNDGVRAIDGSASGPVAAIGRGSLTGTGNMASNGTAYSLTNYQTGQGPSMVVGSQGQSMATNGTPSDLRIGDTANVLVGNVTTNNASVDGSGFVNAQNSQVSGQSVISLGQTQSGNASMVAQGGGAGPSNAKTDTRLSLNGPNGTVQNTAVKGSVAASGQTTFVQSVSNVANNAGQQSLFNSQNATSQSSGSGSATASNSAILKRRRRRHLEQMEWTAGQWMAQRWMSKK